MKAIKPVNSAIKLAEDDNIDNAIDPKGLFTGVVNKKPEPLKNSI